MLQLQTTQSVSIPKCFIYVLLDPRNNQVRYVGKTIHSIQDRLQHHINEAKRGKHSHKCNWIRSLLQKGLLPTIEVIDRISEKDFEFFEKRYIKLYKSFGARLTNLTNGGQGLSGHIFAKKHREELSRINKGVLNPQYGKKQSKETLLKRSKAMKGKLAGEKHPQYGKKQTEESNRKRSKAMTGKMVGKKNPRYGVKVLDSTRKLLSKAFSGKNHPNYGKVSYFTGKHHTKKTRKLLRELNLGENNPMFGKKQTEESNKKRSESLKESWRRRKEKLNKHDITT